MERSFFYREYYGNLMATNNSKNQPTAASGKIVQAQGVGVANGFTSASFPSTSGTIGNILVSDGNDWVSTASSGTTIGGFVGTSQSNPVDSTTYYIGQSNTFIGITDSSLSVLRFYATTNFTLNKIYANFKVAGVLGSASNCTFFVRVNNTSNTNITTTLQLTAADNIVNVTTLGLALTAGDYFSFGFTGPAWATNPTAVSVAIAFSS